MAGLKVPHKGGGNGSDLTVTNPQHLDAIRTLRDRRLERNDTWFNSRSKFGGNADPVIVSQFIRSRARMSREEAEVLYEFDWLSARIVDQLANDATREWISFKHEDDPEKAEKLRKEDDRLNGRSLFKEAITWGRLHGGALLVVGAWDGQDPEEPLNIDRIRKIMYLHVVDRWLAYPTDWYRDPEDPLFGQVSLYRINRLTPIGAPTIVVHESRTIRFDGNMLPPVARVRNWGWSASVLDKVFDALRNWGISNQAAASVIPSFITVAMKIGNLQQLIQNKDFATIRTRLAEFQAQMATHNLTFYGDGEEIQKLGTPITGLPELMTKFMEVISGAADYPKSILFQAETGSLGGNAANTDQDNYFNKVVSYQAVVLRSKVRRWLDEIGVPIGLAPGEVEFEFLPLKKNTPEQEAEVYLKTAQADQILINTGMVDAPERIGIFRMGGDKWNGMPPVVNTERMEKFIEQLEKEEIVAHDPRAEEGLGLEQSELNMEHQEESFDAEGKPNDNGNRLNKADLKEVLEGFVQDNSALLEGDVEEVDKPKKRKKKKEAKGGGGLEGTVGDSIETPPPVLDRDFIHDPSLPARVAASAPRTMTIVANRDPASGALVATVQEGAPAVHLKKSDALPHPPEGIKLNTPEHQIWAMVKARADSGEVITVEEISRDSIWADATAHRDLLDSLMEAGHLVEKDDGLHLPQHEEEF